MVPKRTENISRQTQTLRSPQAVVEQVARLAQQGLLPEEFFRELLQQAITALLVVSGAVRRLDGPGRFKVVAQIQLDQVGLASNADANRSHDKLLWLATQKGQMIGLQGRSGVNGPPDSNQPGNLTDLGVILAPIVVDGQVSTVLELWCDPVRTPAPVPWLLPIVEQLAQQAAGFLRRHRLREIDDKQQLWTQLEAFSQQIHASLHPLEVSYLVANEGRRLIECDRLSVVQREGKRGKVLAVSGAEVVEKRSSLVQHLARLCARVFTANEKLVYNGAPDDSLPPLMRKELDEYLAESHSKLLVVLPVRDSREKDDDRPCRSALVLESFETTTTTEQMLERLEVIGRHSAAALYNAAEYRRIPFHWLWRPVTTLQEQLGGKARSVMIVVLAALAVVILALIVIPYPLKMDAKGQVLPETRFWIYSPKPGHVVQFEVDPAVDVVKNQELILMKDSDLQQQLVNLAGEIKAAEDAIQAANSNLDGRLNENERKDIGIERRKQEKIRDLKIQERDRLCELANAVVLEPGKFWLKAPMNGTILNADFRENLTGKFVRPSDPLLRIGDRNGPWEVELKIPEKHIAPVLEAAGGDRELDVDLLLLSEPTRIFKGKLARNKIAGEAVIPKDDSDETEPVVTARVRIDGDDIDKASRIPRDLLLTGTRVHARVRCGNRAMGYSLFYGVWEFLFEKVVFAF